MRITLIALALVLALLNLSNGQTKADESNAPLWTEADRKYLLDNLIRSKEEILAETKDLTKEQWNLKKALTAGALIRLSNTFVFGN